MGSLFDILNFIGGGLCHQIVERSFGTSGFHMPVCSRCTGIYTGFLISLVFIILLERSVKGEFPSTKMVMISAGVFLIMGAEVALSTFRVIESFTVARFITGFGAGWFIAYLLLPLKNSVMFRKYRKKYYLDSRGRFTAWLLIAPVMMALFIYTYRNALLLWSMLSITGMIFFVSFILLILSFSLIRKLGGRIKSPKAYVLVIVTVVPVAVAVLSLLSYIRKFLL